VPDNPFPTSLRRNRDDPRPLAERISAQILERIDEAVEMAGIHLLVELRKAEGRPPPQGASTADRQEFEARARELLQALRQAFDRELGPEERAALAAEEAAHTDERQRLLAAQVHLARTLPDYWQRLEAHRAAYVAARLAAATRSPSLFRRLLGR